MSNPNYCSPNPSTAGCHTFGSYVKIRDRDMDELSDDLNAMTSENKTPDEWRQILSDGFDAADSAGLVYAHKYLDFYGNTVANSYFPLAGCKAKGQAVWIVMEPNKVPGQQPWYGPKPMAEPDLLNKLDSTIITNKFNLSQPNAPFIVGRFVFPSSQKCIDFLKNLADAAEDEPWDWRGAQSPQWVLRSYVQHTFERLIYEDIWRNIVGEPPKIKTLSTRRTDEIYFNTGLFHSDTRGPIYLGGDAEYLTDSIPGFGTRRVFVLRNLKLFYNGGDPIERLRDSVGPPQRASYIGKDDRLFCEDLELVLNIDHIFSQGVDGRFPQKYVEAYAQATQQDKALQEKDLKNRCHACKRKAMALVKGNYQRAILQVDPEDLWAIQYLLPMYFDDRDEPDFVLVVRREGDCYNGVTILPLEAAYRNSRLIAKPNASWLKPPTP